MRDRSFLDARYIRIVNHGTNRWFPSTMTMSVDGQSLVNRLPLTTRKGSQPRGGIERWNRDHWPQVTYWEAELTALRRAQKR